MEIELGYIASHLVDTIRSAIFGMNNEYAVVVAVDVVVIDTSREQEKKDDVNLRSENHIMWSMNVLRVVFGKKHVAFCH